MVRFRGGFQGLFGVETGPKSAAHPHFDWQRNGHLVSLSVPLTVIIASSIEKVKKHFSLVGIIVGT